jgi:hypothetical protein
MRIIGLDIHRAFAEAVASDEDELKRRGASTCAVIFSRLSQRSSPRRIVVLEATDNASTVAAVIAPHVKQVVIASPKPCASSLMRRSKRIRSTRKSSPSFRRAVFCGKSGCLMSRCRGFAGR